MTTDAGLSPGAIDAALRAATGHATDRAPDGRRLRRMRIAIAGHALWLFPAALEHRSAGGRLICESVTLGRPAGDPRRYAFWLATAARQCLWRALRVVPGLLPVIRVEPWPAETALTLACLVPPHRAHSGLQAALRALAQDRAGHWTRFATARARGGGAAK